MTPTGGEDGRVDVCLVEDHGLMAHSLLVALEAEGLRAHRCLDLDPDHIRLEVALYRPRVVLLDLDLGEPWGSSLPLIPDLQRLETDVVVVTASTDRLEHAACLEAGALGVVTKASAFDALVAAVRRAVDGHALIDPHQRHERLAELRAHRRASQQRLADFEELTPREREVLLDLASGRSVQRIADDWVVSVVTVRSHVRSLLHKLGVRSQLEAVARARASGWLDRVERR